MFHEVLLVGNLGRDPEMRYTQNGDPVTNFSMATSEKWTGQDGQKQERTIWWRVAVWGKTGEAVNEYMKKGSKVLVKGRMVADAKGNPRMFDRQDGSKGTSFEVTATTVKFLSSKNDDAARGGHDNGDDGADEAEIPF